MRFLRVGMFGVVLAPVLAPSVVAAAAHRVAVVEAGTSRIPRGEVAALRADVDEVVRSLGAEIVPFVEAKAAAGGDCNQPDCMIAIHRVTGATHVLRVESVFKKGSFALQLQMWDARAGRTLSSDGKSCDICTLPDLHAALRDRVAALCARVFEAEEAALAPPPVPVPPPPPPPALNVSPPAPAPQPASSAGKRIGQVGGLTMVALGVAAAAYGGYLLHLNGQVACAAGERNNCTQHHVTAGRGTGFLAGGIGAALAGGFVFYYLTW
jgi:hypothetical protein